MTALVMNELVGHVELFYKTIRYTFIGTEKLRRLEAKKPRREKN